VKKKEKNTNANVPKQQKKRPNAPTREHASKRGMQANSGMQRGHSRTHT
jgi:hypothetical protein